MYFSSCSFDIILTNNFLNDIFKQVSCLNTDKSRDQICIPHTVHEHNNTYCVVKVLDFFEIIDNFM